MFNNGGSGHCFGYENLNNWHQRPALEFNLDITTSVMMQYVIQRTTVSVRIF